MSENTRRELLDRAEALFAERGFDGVSLADISGAMGLTKQALLHYFKSKEGLYGEVLKRIADAFDQQNASLRVRTSDPAEQLRALLASLYRDDAFNAAWVRLLMRELLDNNRRAQSAETWYLRAYLDSLTDLVERLPAWPKDGTRQEALASVYLFLGAINYFRVSGPTLSGIFGEDSYKTIDAAMRARLDQAISQFIIQPHLGVYSVGP